MPVLRTPSRGHPPLQKVGAFYVKPKQLSIMAQIIVENIVKVIDVSSRLLDPATVSFFESSEEGAHVKPKQITP
jgi:hypothetical protein